MSYTRIKSFLSWLTNKWCGNLFRFPLAFHKECLEDGMKNISLHLMSTGIIIALAFSFMVKDADGNYTGALPWDILFYCNILHFLYCIIRIQYNKYIAEMNSTMTRLKDQHE